MMRQVIALTVIALITSCLPSQAIDLARDGQALVPIVSDGTGGIEAAVRDLKRYLDAATGAQFEVAESAQGPAIHVGPTHYAPRESDAQRSPWLVEQIVQIQTRDGSLYLTGGGIDGARFAVYAFLEDLCGLRFFHAGDLGTHIPDSPDLSFEDVDVRQVPSFVYRRMWPSSRTPDRRMYREWQTWYHRSRQGGPSIHMGHNLFRIVPPELYDEHPEYFPEIGGVRIDPRGGAQWQPELASQGVIDLAAEKAIAAFEENPDQFSYSLSMNDSAGWSESEEALAQDPEEFRGSQDRGKARRMIVFANAVAEQTSERFPDRYLVFYAYKSTLEPPDEPQVHPNVIPSIAHWGMAADPFHPIAAPEAVSPPNAIYREAIEGWDQIAEKLIAREYWTAPRADPLLKSGVAPILFEDIPYYHHHGFMACNSEANIAWGNLALNHYVAARLMWKVDTDPRALLDDYFAKYYDDAAEPMRAYFTRIWEVAYKHYLPEEIAVPLAEEDVDFLAQRLEEAAVAAVGDDLRAARVQMARDLFETWRMRRALLEGQPTPEQISAYMDHLDALAAEETDALVVPAWQQEFMAPVPEPAAYEGPDLVRALPDEPLDPEQARPLIARRGGTWLVLVGEDRRIDATAIGVRVGPQYAHRPAWIVATRDGAEVASGHMPMPGEAELSVEVPAPGLYQLQANAGMNGCGFVVHNAPAVMVGPGMKLCERPGEMYFWVPEACERFTITLFAGKSESAAIRIFRPDGTEAFSGDSLTRDALPATLNTEPDERGRAWRLLIEEAPEGMMEDYSVLLGDALPPFLATSEGALLIPAK
ncbi:MAG: DUF4838 domain-containing protein [Armatimonadota bacterium]